MHFSSGASCRPKSRSDQTGCPKQRRWWARSVQDPFVTNTCLGQRSKLWIVWRHFRSFRSPSTSPVRVIPSNSCADDGFQNSQPAGRLRVTPRLPCEGPGQCAGQQVAQLHEFDRVWAHKLILFASQFQYVPIPDQTVGKTTRSASKPYRQQPWKMVESATSLLGWLETLGRDVPWPADRMDDCLVTCRLLAG